MEAASASETSVNFYQTTRRYNPEDSHLHTCSYFRVDTDRQTLLVCKVFLYPVQLNNDWKSSHFSDIFVLYSGARSRSIVISYIAYFYNMKVVYVLSICAVRRTEWIVRPT
jgi:hypothetical protein